MTTNLSVAAITAFLCASMVLSTAHAQSSLKPLSKDDVVNLLKGDVPTKRVEALVRERGIDFQVTPQIEDDLLNEGADKGLLSTLKQLAPKPPTLVITTTPGGARVYIDDEFLDTTSAEGRLKLATLAPGRHRLRLSLAGYSDYEKSVELVAGQTLEVGASLGPTVVSSGTADKAKPATVRTLHISIWAAESPGRILHSADGGDSWKLQKSGSDEWLFSIVFATPQSGWAVGDNGTVVHTADGGVTWQTQRKKGFFSTLFCVDFVTPQSGWAVGTGGTILHTEDEGTTWKPQNSGTKKWLSSVVFVTAKSGWAVGQGGTILHTEDEGLTWKPQTNGNNKNLKSVAFATPQSGWAVGESGTILHTEDGGLSWKAQTSGTEKGLLSVAFATPQSGWAVGESGTILHTEDGGLSWKAQTSGTQKGLWSVAFAAPQSGWAVGGKGTILHTEDSGHSWKVQASGTRDVLWSIAFAKQEGPRWQALPRNSDGIGVRDSGTNWSENKQQIQN